ncbi:MAG: hypothetical protein HFE47_01610 [Clostridia bacterium]|nr:hypothetical protein [Clostridia bacterium]
MKNAMFVGLAIGMVAGACIASNSQKTRKAVTDAQDKIKTKLCPNNETEWQGGESSGNENGGY